MIDVIRVAGTINFLRPVLSSTPPSSFAIVVIIILGICNFIFFYLEYSLIRSVVRARWMINLRRDGMPVEVRIISRNSFNTRRGVVSFIKYSYDYQGKTYSYKQSLDKASYASLSERNTLSAHCSARHPSVVQLDGPLGERPQFIAALIVAIIWLCFTLFWFLIFLVALISML